MHKVLEIHGKGGKERLVPLLCIRKPRHHWRRGSTLPASGKRPNRPAIQARPARPGATARQDLRARPLNQAGIPKLVEGYVLLLKLDPNVTVHSFRVTALTTASKHGSDIIDLQEFAGACRPEDDAHLYQESGTGSPNHRHTGWHII